MVQFDAGSNTPRWDKRSYHIIIRSAQDIQKYTLSTNN